MQKQVDKSHYDFFSYMPKKRWASIWHQVDEILRFKPESVLEIGPGTGILKSTSRLFGLCVKTLDLDPELDPDYISSADKILLPDQSFDVVCAFQVLEHLPFEDSLQAFSEMSRIARKAVIISLPDANRAYANTISIPYIRTIKFIFNNPFQSAKAHRFDGEHYWEIGKKGYSLKDVVSALKGSTQRNHQVRTYRVHEHPYHRFLIFSPETQ